MAMLQFCVLVCLFSVVTIINNNNVSCSSIPMWEYLTKDEKMAYLYSLFKNQVDEFCEFSEMENCINELTKYGLKKLREMPENKLDEMDPYQRGASAIIWNSMMEGHRMMKTTPKVTTTTTPKPQDLLDDEQISDNSFGSQGEASAKIENVYRLPPPKGFVYANSVEESYQSGQPQYRYPQNAIPVDQYQKGSTFYVKYPATTLTPPPPPTTTRRSYQEGPVVVRVYPDGTPVRDSQNSVPQDEDLRQFLLSKVKLPEV